MHGEPGGVTVPGAHEVLSSAVILTSVTPLSVPDINMLDYLPDFLDGIFNMLSDGNREIRQAADSALGEVRKFGKLYCPSVQRES